MAGLVADIEFHQKCQPPQVILLVVKLRPRRAKKMAKNTKESLALQFNAKVLFFILYTEDEYANTIISLTETMKEVQSYAEYEIGEDWTEEVQKNLPLLEGARFLSHGQEAQVVKFRDESFLLAIRRGVGMEPDDMDWVCLTDTLKQDPPPIRFR